MAISSSSVSAAILCICSASNISTCPKLPFFSMPSNSAKLHTMTQFKPSSNSRVFASPEVLETQRTNFEVDTLTRKQVEHALDQPLHRSTPRLQARQYISIYEELESKDESLLRLAKQDFNLEHVLHKQELSELSRWWKKLGITKFGYARDRLVESYCCGLAAFYEPQYTVTRVMITKVAVMLTLLDDTYDSYGTIEELQMFTDAVQKWNVEEIDQLPNYMKICYKALLDLFDHFEEEIKEDGRSYAVDASKQAMKHVILGYFTEAKWVNEGHSPPFSEFLRNALITVCMGVLMPVCCLRMTGATKEVFSWLSQNPQIARLTAIIGRMVNDISGYEVSRRRGQITSIDCYMKEFGVTKEEAFLKCKEMAEDAWKEINEEFVKPSRMPGKFMGPILNLARLFQTFYMYDEDNFTYPEKVLKYHIASMVIEPVPI